MSKPTVNDMMESYAQDAVDFAQNNFKITLDYSPESIEYIEKIAAQLEASIPKSKFARLFKKGPSDEEIDQVCKMLGGYIGEVYRRERNGEWGFNQDVAPGNLVIELKCGDLAMFPPAKVHKRLVNGAEDNLQSYFTVMVEQSWKPNA